MIRVKLKVPVEEVEKVIGILKGYDFEVEAIVPDAIPTYMLMEAKKYSSDMVKVWNFILQNKLLRYVLRIERI